MRVLVVILAACMAVAAVPGCKEKPEPNPADFEQFDADNSTDYRYIFRETLRDQEEKSNKLKKYDFR